MEEAIVTRVSDGPPARYAIGCPRPDHDEPISHGETLEQLATRHIRVGGDVQCAFGHMLRMPASFRETIELQ